MQLVAWGQGWVRGGERGGKQQLKSRYLGTQTAWLWGYYEGLTQPRKAFSIPPPSTRQRVGTLSFHEPPVVNGCSLPSRALTRRPWRPPETHRQCFRRLNVLLQPEGIMESSRIQVVMFYKLISPHRHGNTGGTHHDDPGLVPPKDYTNIFMPINAHYIGDNFHI